MPLFGKRKKSSDKPSGGAAYPTQGQAVKQAMANPPPPAPVPGYDQPPGYYPPPAPQQPVQVQGTFDQGARFNPGQPVHIPPPPPGVAPTQAQVAAQQGQPVVMTQQQRDVWGGGSDGGMSMF